jgi:hypothetical protein
MPAAKRSLLVLVAEPAQVEHKATTEIHLDVENITRLAAVVGLDTNHSLLGQQSASLAVAEVVHRGTLPLVCVQQVLMESLVWVTTAAMAVVVVDIPNIQQAAAVVVPTRLGLTQVCRTVATVVPVKPTALLERR